MEYAACIKYVVEFNNLSWRYNRLLQKTGEDLKLTESDKILIEESLFVKHFTEWELLVYNLFNYCIAIDTSALASYIGLPLPANISLDNSYAIVNGLHFTSFSSSADILKWSKRLIATHNNCFNQFLDPIWRYIDEAYIIRNYISHKSIIAKRKLNDIYAKYELCDFVEPGQFLKQIRDFELWGTYHTSNLYYHIFMQTSILSWRLLDKTSYMTVFSDEKSDGGMLFGYVRMNLMFQELAKQFGWEL